MRYANAVLVSVILIISISVLLATETRNADGTERKNSLLEMLQNGLQKVQQTMVKKDGKSAQERTRDTWFKLPEQVRQQTLALLNNRSIPVDQRMNELDSILKPYGGRSVSFHEFFFSFIQIKR